MANKTYRKNAKNPTKKKKQKTKWTAKDTKFLYPTLTEKEAKMAWEMGW